MQAPPPNELSAYLKCVVYDLYVLATAVETMAAAKSHELAEVGKTAALIKLRTVYDFLHRPKASDSIKVAMFAGCNPTLPAERDTEWEPRWLTLQSVNTYVAHLDKERAADPKTIPQPKFLQGQRAVLRVAVEIMHEARTFVGSVLASNGFPAFDELGRGWHVSFVNTLSRLDVLRAHEGAILGTE